MTRHRRHARQRRTGSTLNTSYIGVSSSAMEMGWKSPVEHWHRQIQELHYVQSQPEIDDLTLKLTPKEALLVLFPAPATMKLSTFSMPSSPKARSNLLLAVFLAACTGLIFLSSTWLAGVTAFYVYRHFLRGLVSFYIAQKAVHVTMFLAFGALCYFVLPWPSRARRFASTVITCFLVGTTSEILQLFTHRDPSIADAAINLASGTVGAILALVLSPPSAPNDRT